jgi:hypothetical protein
LPSEGVLLENPPFRCQTFKGNLLYPKLAHPRLDAIPGLGLQEIKGIGFPEDHVIAHGPPAEIERGGIADSPHPMSEHEFVEFILVRLNEPVIGEGLQNARTGVIPVAAGRLDDPSALAAHPFCKSFWIHGLCPNSGFEALPFLGVRPKSFLLEKVFGSPNSGVGIVIAIFILTSIFS